MLKNAALIFCLLVTGLCVGADGIIAQTPSPDAAVAGNKVSVDLIPSQSRVEPGQSFQIAIRFKIAPQWHVYWVNPGDSGLAPSVEWKLPKGVTIDPKLHFPVPVRLQVNKDVESFAYENELVLLADVKVDQSIRESFSIDGKIDWLVCNDICIAESANVSAKVAIGESSPTDERFEGWRKKVATPSNDKLQGVVWTDPDKKSGNLSVQIPADEADLKKIDLLPPALDYAVFGKPMIEKSDNNQSSITVPFRVLPGMTQPMTGEGMLVRIQSDGTRHGELIKFTFNFVK